MSAPHKKMLPYSILFVVLAGHLSAFLLHDGVDINAKLPMPFPIPGTEFDDELLAINTSHARNDSGSGSIIVTQNVTVRTPFLTVQVANSSEIPKSPPPDDSSLKRSPSSLLPKASDLGKTMEYLDVPVSVAELVDLATAESPAHFREKFYASPLLQHIMADVEDKAKYYHEVTHLLDQPGGATPTKRVAKREAIFSLHQNVEGPRVMVDVRQPEFRPQEVDDYATTYYNYSEYEPQVYNFSEYAVPEDIESLQSLARHSNSSTDAVDYSSPLSRSQTVYSPVGRLFLPHLRTISHPLRPFTSASPIRGSRRPLLISRPRILRPIIRPVVPSPALLPIVRAFANPQVIRSLIQAIPSIPPLIARGEQIIHPPITSYSSTVFVPIREDLGPASGVYAYEKPPADSEFEIPGDKLRPLSPLEDSFSTLLHDFSVTRGGRCAQRLRRQPNRDTMLVMTDHLSDRMRANGQLFTAE